MVVCATAGIISLEMQSGGETDRHLTDIPKDAAKCSALLFYSQPICLYIGGVKCVCKLKIKCNAYPQAHKFNLLFCLISFSEGPWTFTVLCSHSVVFVHNSFPEPVSDLPHYDICSKPKIR